MRSTTTMTPERGGIGQTRLRITPTRHLFISHRPGVCKLARGMFAFCIATAIYCCYFAAVAQRHIAKIGMRVRTSSRVVVQFDAPIEVGS